MRLRLSAVSVALLSSITISAAALAQGTPAARPAPRLGLLAGLNLSTVGGDDVDDAEGRTGGIFGGYVSLGIGRSWAIQPEVLFSMKGATDNSGGDETTLKVNYIEVPLLLRLNIPTAGSVDPHVYAGPSFAYRASCKLSGQNAGVSASIDCDDLDELAGEDIVDIAKMDWGLALGGGLGFDLAGRALNLGVRYTLGLKEISNGGDVYNRVLSFIASYEFPIGRR
jgi:outer membrane protein with beta-barrel domain